MLNERDRDPTLVLLNSCGFPGYSGVLWTQYETPPPSGHKEETINGTHARITEDEFAGQRSCFVMWSLGRPPTPHAPARSEHMATVSADECPQARERAAALIDVLAVPPPVEVAPQRPVLYPPDEPDMP